LCNLPNKQIQAIKKKIMETQNITPNELSKDKIVSAPAKSKFGIIGLILGVLGFFTSCSSLLLTYFIMGISGGLDIIDPPYKELIFFAYCGFFFGITGGILGGVSLRRGDNKLASSISFIVGSLTLFICSAVTYLFWVLYKLSLQLIR